MTKTQNVFSIPKIMKGCIFGHLLLILSYKQNALKTVNTTQKDTFK